MLLRAPFETRHPSGVNGSVPGTALDRWSRPAKATDAFALLRILADPLSRDLTVSPDELGTDTLVIVG